MVNPKGKDTEDKAAVLYRGGDYKQPHLLGIPKFVSSAGIDVEAGELKELARYDIPLDKCLGTCYDTTASNSGHKSGAHFRIEKQVKHAVLELESGNMSKKSMSPMPIKLFLEPPKDQRSPTTESSGILGHHWRKTLAICCCLTGTGMLPIPS